MVPVFVLLVKCVTMRVFLPELFSHGRFSITTINQTIIACISVVQGVGLGRQTRCVSALKRWPYVALWDWFRDGRRRCRGRSCN